MKPFIVAEISANHLGDKQRAAELVDAAAWAGADAVKFQAWTPGTMCVDKDYTIETGTWAGCKLHELYEDAWTPWEWLPQLFEKAKNEGMVGFASVFDTGALAYLEDIGCPIYKISSFELVDIPLIQAVARTGKPMILSTGMATFEEITSAWAHAGASGCRDITLLQCTSAYPARPEHANLQQMKLMQRAFGSERTKVGLSDHTMGIGVAVAAVALGATVIEKHLTLSRKDGGPDSAFSMEPKEFKQMVEECRNAYDAVNGVDQPIQYNSLRRSVYLAKDIQKGETITSEHLTTARPGEGMDINRMHIMIGRQSNIDAPAGTPFKEQFVW